MYTQYLDVAPARACVEVRRWCGVRETWVAGRELTPRLVLLLLLLVS